MQDFLLEGHSGWRYLVILATIITALYFVYALATKNTKAKQEALVMRVWAIVLDIQLLLGLLLLVSYVIDDRYYGQLTGHWTLGIVAVFIAHIPAIFKRLNGEPSAQIRRMMGVALPIASFAVIIFGLAAIDRGLFG